ncbi:MAG: endo alpha-1,4 polygalactosaminidase [Eubacteriales bacterium]|nr:endo alpha-1,4 polygalactosaminidase [Eubacteriales bacterium]
MDGCKGKKKYRSVLRFVTATLIWSMLLETSAGGISAAELSFFEEEALNVTETGTESLPAETDEYGNQTATYAPVFADLPAADGEQTAQEDLPESIPDSALEVTWQEEEPAETGETSDRGEPAETAETSEWEEQAETGETSNRVEPVETGEISEWDGADIGGNDDEIILDRDQDAEDVGAESMVIEGEESEDTGQEAPAGQGEASVEAGEELPEEQGEAVEEAGTESLPLEGGTGEEVGTEVPEDQREGIEEAGPESSTEEKEGNGDTLILSEEGGEESAGSEAALNAAAAKNVSGTQTASAPGSGMSVAGKVIPQSRRLITKARIRLSRTGFVYTGKRRKPAVTVVYGKTKLKRGTDYSLKFRNNLYAGKASVTITGKGKYRGSVKRTFRIFKAAQKLTLKAPSRLARGKKAVLKAGGARGTKKYTFKTSNSGIASVTSKGIVTARKIGTVRITVRTAASRNYKAGRRTITLKIVPGAVRKIVCKNMSRGIRLSWTRAAGANGYVIYRDGKKIRTIGKGTVLSCSDTAANRNGKKYTYKIVAKASTGMSTLHKSAVVYRTMIRTKSPGEKTRYCFEQEHVAAALRRSGKNELAVIDMDGISRNVIRAARKRGVQIYGYLNAGALENSRSYYSKFRNLRLARYSGWSGEYWVDVTGKGWTSHLISEARKMKKAGATGVFLDNTDILYMVKEGFEKSGADLYRRPPSAAKVYKVLRKVVKKIEKEVGIVVMPNGGDVFVKQFVRECPGVIKVVCQESVLYMDGGDQEDDDRRYLTSYLDWCKKRGIYVRGIEYTDSASDAAIARNYYRRHGWLGVYISRHGKLKGD